MNRLLRWLEDINAAALMALAAIFVALLAQGANSAASAAFLSFALILGLIVTILLAHKDDISQTLGSNWIALIAAAAFAGLAALSVAPALPQAAQPHPLWDLVGGQQRPASLSPYRTIEGLVAFFGAGAAYLLGALLAPTSRARDAVGRWTIALAILYALIGLYLLFAVGQATGARLDVGVSSANAAAALFGVLMLAAAALVVRGARGRLWGSTQEQKLPPGWRWAGFILRAPLSFSALVLLFACLLLTASRGGLIATAIGFVIFVAALLAQGFRSTGVRGGAIATPLLMIAAVIAILFLRGGEEVLQRFALASEDMELRRALAEAHWARFLEQPVFGHGLNTYHELNVLSGTPENWYALRYPGSAHNIVIQALEETGVVGLALWVLMLTPAMWRALTRLAGRRSGSEWAAAMLAATTLLLVHGLVDFALQTPAIAALYAFLLGGAVGRTQRDV